MTRVGAHRSLECEFGRLCEDRVSKGYRPSSDPGASDVLRAPETFIESEMLRVSSAEDATLLPLTLLYEDSVFR